MRRMMLNKFEGLTFYESSFETERGVLVREIETRPSQPHSYSSYSTLDDWLAEQLPRNEREGFKTRWRERFGNRMEPFSPSPETIDISITDWCDFGCTYCYQDSTAKQKHAPNDLVDKVIKSFRHRPYQIAIGGGEPTAHPDFPGILRRARAAGVVPNYTTAGHIVRPDVIEATNEACGGVAMTFHAWKGLAWFAEHYSKLRSLLTCQLNVHLIADKNVTTNLNALRELQKTVGKLNVVLLAYYPDVGRGTLENIMPKPVYHGTLPLAVKRAISSGMTLAFSEGLLPYFFSRPELGVETKFASRAEGQFSAYVDPRGRMSKGSFDPPPKPGDSSHRLNPEASEAERAEWLERALKQHATVWEGDLQAQWDKLGDWGRGPSGGSCHRCKHKDSCTTPSKHHYFVCAYAKHNGAPITLDSEAQADADEMAIAEEIVVEEQRLGRKLTDAEQAPYTARFRAVRGT